MRIASFFYALALLTLGAGPATKVFFGGADTLWIDPPLVFSLLALITLLPTLTRENTTLWRRLAWPLMALLLICGISAAAGFALLPTDELYGALREPLRFALVLAWFATSCWFLEQRPKLVFRSAAAGAALALLSGLYVYAAAMHLLPAPLALIVYGQQYWIRQAIWVSDLPVPRMGGLFIEAPPFGLLMLGLVVLFAIALRSGIRTKATILGLVIALAGAIASLSDQVMLAMFVCLAASVLSLKMRSRWLRPAVLGLALCLISTAAILSLRTKLIAGPEIGTAEIIYRSSVGERNFHARFGMSLLEESAATVFGIGPGRYGEYVAETGLFPDTVTMQYTVPEILVEWGAVGLGVWLIVLSALGAQAWKTHRLAGLGFLAGLMIADSFQSNWKSESVFLALAALCVQMKRVHDGAHGAQEHVEAAS